MAAALLGSLLVPVSVAGAGRQGSSTPGGGRITAAPVTVPPGRTSLVSKNRKGGYPNGSSLGPVVSADARFVAFASSATNLVAGDDNGTQDVFLVDRETGDTIRLPVMQGPVPTGGSASEPSISADGRVVAFTFQPPPGASVALGSIVVAYDRMTGSTTTVSTVVRGSLSASARQPSVAADGRFVAFTSNADLVGEGEAVDDVFRYDRETGVMAIVSVNRDGRRIAGQAASPSISGDGNVVAFVSDAGRSVTFEDPGAGSQIYARDMAAKRTERVSMAAGGRAANGAASDPAISGDGRYVAFASRATNLASGPGAGAPGLFRRDRQTGTTILVSLTPRGTAAQGASGQPSITLDGSVVAFTSASQDLVAARSGGVMLAASRQPADVFVRDITAGETVLVSVTLDGGSTFGAGSRSHSPAVAGGGRYVAFASDSPRMAKGDRGTFTDVFLRDRVPVPPVPAATPPPQTAKPPAPTITPPELDLGSLALGAAGAPGAAVLTNAGGSPLRVIGASITGVQASSFSIVMDGCADRVLAPGEGCSVSVVFMPDGEGDRSARLEIADAYAGSPRTVRLLGRVSRGMVTLDPPIGPPGMVVVAIGSGFPAGIGINLAWSDGITPDLGEIVTDANGGFRVGVLVFHNDVTGIRDLLVEPADGTALPPTRARMRVTQATVVPPGFWMIRRPAGVPPWLLFRG